MTGNRGATTIRMKPSRQQLSRWLRQRQPAATGRLGSMARTACTTLLRYGTVCQCSLH